MSTSHYSIDSDEGGPYRLCPLEGSKNMLSEIISDAVRNMEIRFRPQVEYRKGVPRDPTENESEAGSPPEIRSASPIPDIQHPVPSEPPLTPLQVHLYEPTEETYSPPHLSEYSPDPSFSVSIGTEAQSSRSVSVQSGSSQYSWHTVQEVLEAGWKYKDTEFFHGNLVANVITEPRSGSLRILTPEGTQTAEVFWAVKASLGQYQNYELKSAALQLARKGVYVSEAEEDLLSQDEWEKLEGTDWVYTQIPAKATLKDVIHERLSVYAKNDGLPLRLENGVFKPSSLSTRWLEGVFTNSSLPDFTAVDDLPAEFEVRAVLTRDDLARMWD